MKAFHFRLDQVLKWRASQVDVEKGKLAAAAARIAHLRRDVVLFEQLLAEEAARYLQGPTGSELNLWAAFHARTRKQIADLHEKEKTALVELNACRQSLLEADRRLRLLQNLNQTRHARWLLDWNRELEAFAAESFLSKLQLEKARARSSSG